MLWIIELNLFHIFFMQTQTSVFSYENWSKVMEKP